MSDFRRIESEADIEAARQRELAVIYKHSPYCGLSTAARFEMSHFAQGNGGVPVYIVDVIHQRGLSLRIAEQFAIEHESPQVILLRRGRPVFDASHRGVSAHALERELEERVVGAAGSGQPGGNAPGEDLSGRDRRSGPSGRP